MSRRVALIGAGLAAGPHLQALREMDCEVPVVATTSRERFSAVRTLFPRVEQAGVADALAANVDAALVLTPPGTHLDIVEAAAAAGVPVVVEKPVEISLPRAERLVGVAERAGIGLAVCFQHRAKPAAQALQRALTAESMGDVLGGAVTVPWWRSPAYYQQPGRGTYRRDGGGVLITQAVHVLDLLVWLIGAPQRLSAVAGYSPLHHAEVETTISMLLDYGHGRGVTFFATVAAAPGADEELTLVTTTGTAHMRGARLHLTGSSGTVRIEDEENSAGVADPAALPSSWHRALLRDALESFEYGSRPLGDAGSAIRTQQVVTAAYHAAMTGEWAEIDHSVGLEGSLA